MKNIKGKAGWTINPDEEVLFNVNLLEAVYQQFYSTFINFD
ncbi:MAG: hypothetical protein ACI9ES_002053 [Oceanospirillaceae bacterium]|jgi:hypothetical protein